MENSSHYPNAQCNSKSRAQSTVYYSTSPSIQYPAGFHMARNGSNDSAYCSAATEVSDDAYFQPRSPATMSFSAGSPSYYGNDHLSPQQYLPSSYFTPSRSLEQIKSEQTPSSRVTLSSLGWKSEADFIHLYKFVIPKGRVPYFELAAGNWPTYSTPEKVFLDPPSNFDKHEFPCLYPGACEEKIFKRPADLERHYRNVHGGPDQKENLLCDYPHCTARGAFTRKDHFRDHLRDYHKEDLGSAKREKKKGDRKIDEKQWVRAQAIWIRERKIERHFWRCPKCLQRIQIATSGYDCQDCKHPCDAERVERIEGVRNKTRAKPNYTAAETSDSYEMGGSDYQYSTASSANPPTTYAATCVDCGDTGWIYNHSSTVWDACQTCQPPVAQYYKVDDPWNNGSYANSSR